MKTKLFTLSLTLMFFFNYGLFAQCPGTPDPGYTCIPDLAFEQALIALGHDDIEDGQVLNTSVSGLPSLDVRSKGITDLTGIEAFTNLETLIARYNDLTTTVDLSSNTMLTYLDLFQCSLTEIDVMANTALTHLDLGSLNANVTSRNTISDINVSLNTMLVYLNLNFNELTTLNVDDNLLLQNLGCSGNNLTNLKVSLNTALTSLGCTDNSLTTLDLSTNESLITMSCYRNFGLSSLTLPNTDTVTRLDIYFTALTSLDVSNFDNLETLWCYNSSLEGTLDLSNNTLLQNFDCGNNSLTGLIAPDDNDTLIRFICDNNSIGSLNLSNNNVLQRLECFNNPLMTSLLLPTTGTLTRIDAFSTGITSLDASGVTGLEFLRINNSSSLTSLVLPNTATLQTFWMYGHDLPSINFTPYTNLHTGLQYLDVGNSNLESVDVSMLQNLIEFYCYDSNMLKYLNIANGHNGTLEWMFANFNNSLDCIQVDNKIDAENKDPNQWRIDNTASYEEFCSVLGTSESFKNTITVYPNPAESNLFIESNLDVNYRLLNIQGQEILKGNLISGTSQLNLDGLNNGIYFLKVKTTETVQTEKLIKR